MSQPAHPLLDQIQALFAAYRNLNLSDQGAVQEFTKRITESGLPSYHKEVLAIGLLTKQDGEATLSLHLIRQQEQLRHTEALLNIERRVVEERIRKSQSL